MTRLRCLAKPGLRLRAMREGECRRQNRRAVAGIVHCMSRRALSTPRLQRPFARLRLIFKALDPKQFSVHQLGE